MSRTASGFERMPVDLYQTPAWVFHALAEVVPVRGMTIWEPAAGEGQMGAAMRDAGAHPYQTDVMNHGNDHVVELLDFTKDIALHVNYDAIFTNPPFGSRGVTAEKFIERGLQRITHPGQLLGLLLPSDFDAASTRARFFAGCQAFAGRITLTRRIEWFPDYRSPCKPCEGRGYLSVDVTCKKCRGRGSNKVGPSENHAWFLWRQLLGVHQDPKIWYAPRRQHEHPADATK